MSDTSLEGLALRVQPLGENDRLLTLLSETEGLSRLAVPGSRRPWWAAAACGAWRWQAASNRQPITMTGTFIRRVCARSSRA